MRPILMIVAACAALLFCLPADAGVTASVATCTCCQPQQLIVAPAPVVLRSRAVILQPQVTATAQVVSYEQGTRRLGLFERMRNNAKQRKANRVARVTTWEPIVQTVTLDAEPVTLGVECEE